MVAHAKKPGKLKDDAAVIKVWQRLSDISLPDEAE